MEKDKSLTLPPSLRRVLEVYREQMLQAFANDMSSSFDLVGGALGRASGAVKAASDELAKNVFQADACWITSMGSTTSNHVVMTYTKRMFTHSKKRRILITANPHMSLVNAAIDLGIRFDFIPINIEQRYELLVPPSSDEVCNSIKEHSDTAAIVITSPTYEGLHANISEIVRKIRNLNQDTLVVVDNAWGWGVKTPITEGADIVVRSAHKMDGAWQGGGILLASGKHVDLDLLSECATARFSTSQSYPILASVEQTYRIWHEHGEELEKSLLLWAEMLRTSLKENLIEVLNEASLREWFDKGCIQSLDKRKINLIVKGWVTGYELYSLLQKDFGLVPEKAGIGTLTLIATARALQVDPSEVAKTIAKCLSEKMSSRGDQLFPGNLPTPLNNWRKLKAMEPYEVATHKTMRIPTSEAVNKVAGEVVITYPPGIPLIIPGQTIRKDLIDYLKFVVGLGGHVIAGDPQLGTLRVVLK